ncbi:DUF4912 domain-containing protein [Nodularia sp. NIES-3585]|uniref:DUF4912 domain-containing protein n=1 Tax=Nodularia sp. NIES-3585 TaxID=1973477 RepID=UPI000B6B850F|nr:DUF4912 domain-containing protein [Nodularia sp. NIES-3585]GAX34595.1 hypothetical protein NIES3585_05960 [Nodularia sp. NIES-3585]
MWQQEKKDSAIVSLALLLSLATTPMAVPLFMPTSVLAQSATDAESFLLPENVENGATVRIDGSMSLAAINKSLKQSFEQEFPGQNLEVAANGADVAISALIDGMVDIVAIARSLTPEEAAQGLAQVPFYRENIAIIVSTDNPFQGGLTDQQFADIFRGKITDWSELGAPEGTIRFIDRPDTSDTRNTFRTYPSFKGAEFTTGANATQINEDNTAQIVQQLGNDGISYAMAHHVSQLPNVRVIRLNEVLPDEPDYLYSQPLVYAYRRNPSRNVTSFLSFILASPEQQAIEAARATAANAIAQGEASLNLDLRNVSDEQQPETSFSPDQVQPWWFLLPTAVIVCLLMWIFRSRLWATEAKNDTLDANLNASLESDMEINNPNVSSGVDNDATLPEAATAIGSVDSGVKVDHQEAVETNNSSNYTETDFWDDNVSPWDMEAPAAVVNTPYPQLTDIPKVPFEESKVGDGENWEITDSCEEVSAQAQVKPDLIEDMTSSDTGELAGDLATETSVWSEVDNTVDTIDFSNFDEIIAPASDEQISADVTSLHPTLPTITEDEAIFNLVADAAEPIDSEIDSHLSGEIDIFADSATFVGTGIAASSGNGGNQDAEGQMPNNSTIDALLELGGEQSVVLKSRNAEWAYATWYISDTCHETLQNNDISQLYLRLYDVTDLDLSYQSPQFVQQYELDSEIEIYVAIPQTNSDYIAEIGYLIMGDRWMTIARSQRIRVFDPPVEDTTAEPVINLDGEQSIVLKPRNPEWAYASWFISESGQQTLEKNGISQLYLRLYDVTNLDLSYQAPEFVKQYELESATELYIAIPQSDRDYMAEIGYMITGDRWVTIARSQRIRVFDLPVEDTTAESVINLDGEQSIVLRPRNPEWAYASWFISESGHQALEKNGISQLYLRLYDVTNLDLSYQTPEFVKQYELESGIELYIAIPQSDRDYIAEIGYMITGDRWVTIARSQRVRVFDSPVEDTTAESVINLDGEQSIVLQPRNSEWAYASWDISESGHQALENNGISQLALRLYDATDLDLSYQTPEFVQEYELESGLENKYIAIPQSDRDYIAEIGYVTEGEHWVTIARSQRIRVFGIPLTDTTDESLPTVDATLVNLPQTSNESYVILKSRTPKWAYATWHISTTQKQTLQNHNISKLYLRLYNVTDLDLSYQTPQLVQQYECDEIISDRYVAISATDHDYITEIGYFIQSDRSERWEMIARSERIRVFSRPQADFWFVADAELIIHGSTEPGATVNIAGKPITLKSDGTFHLRIPFSENSINYLMTAIAGNGEQTTTIQKKFSQENSAS